MYLSILLAICLVGIAIIMSKMQTNQFISKNKTISDRLGKYVPNIINKQAPESIENSFNHAYKNLQNIFSISNPEYKLPWYLSINSQNWMEDLDLDNYYNAEISDTNIINWYYFHQAVIINITPQHFDNLNKTIDLLNKYRITKPLDGIILTVDISLFLANKNDARPIIDNAKKIYEKMLNIQKQLNILLPIYIVIDGLDKLDGFNDFASLIPEENMNNMFGWSCPYNLEERYNSIWIDNMFESILDRLEQLQLATFIQGSVEKNCSSMKFFNEYSALKQGIKTYVENLFQFSQYTKTFFLRGVYFIGIYQDKGKKIFINDIINKKILLERNLTKNANGVDFNEKKYHRKLNAIVTTFCMFNFLYCYSMYISLERLKKDINVHIYKIANLLNDKKNIDTSEDPQFMQDAKIILDSIVEIATHRYYYYFTPISWISKLQSNVYSIVESANDKIIVKAIVIKLQELYNELANYDTSSVTQDVKANLNSIYEHISFQKLSDFVDKVYLITFMEEKFNSVIDHNNFDNLGLLINKLFDVQIPRSFYIKSKIFSNAIQNNKFYKVNIHNQRNKIKQNFKELSNNFIDQAFLLNNFVIRFDDLINILLNINKNQNFNLNDCLTLQSTISDLITFANSPNFAWVQKNEIDSPEFHQIIKKISNVYGSTEAEKFAKAANSKFTQLKRILLDIKIPSVGTIFYIDMFNNIRVTSSLMEMHGTINSIFAQPFMQRVELKKITPTKIGQIVTWNIEMLGEINRILKQYNDFVTHKLESYPQNMQAMILRVVKEHLAYVIEAKLADAQKIIYNTANEASAKLVADNIKEGYTDITTMMDHLYLLDEELFDKMLSIMEETSKKVLLDTELRVQGEQLYVFNMLDIEMNHIQKNLVYFPINITNYLITQREKLLSYTKNIITPVISLMSFLKNYDASIFDDDVLKWHVLIEDIENYAKDPQASSLTTLELFIKDFEYLKIEKLSKIVEEHNSLTTNDNYFNNKVVMFKDEMYKKVKKFIDLIVQDNYEKGRDFYDQYQSYFPFNIEGELIQDDAYEKLMKMLEQKANQLQILQKIMPNTENKNMRFVMAMEHISYIIEFLIKPNCIMELEILEPDTTIETYEENLQYLTSATTKVGNTIIMFPDIGKLKITDKISFKFKLSKAKKVHFCIENKLFQVSGHEAVVVLNKMEFIKFLMQNLINKNGSVFIRFKLEISDASHKKQDIVYILPVRMSINGKKIILPSPQDFKEEK